MSARKMQDVRRRDGRTAIVSDWSSFRKLQSFQCWVCIKASLMDFFHVWHSYNWHEVHTSLVSFSPDGVWCCAFVSCNWYRLQENLMQGAVQVLHISIFVCWPSTLCGLRSIDGFLPAVGITSGYPGSPLTIMQQERHLSSREAVKLDKDNSTPWQFKGTQMDVESSREEISKFQRQMFWATQRCTKKIDLLS